MALTVGEISEHLGRAIRRGLNNTQWDSGGPVPGSNEAISSGEVDAMLAILIKWGKDYRLNAVFGTQAERNEAMRESRKFAFEQFFGQDPADVGTGEHNYLTHYLSVIEPGEESI